MRYRFLLAVLTPWVLAGCDQPVTAPADPVDDAALARLAEQVATATDAPLPSLEALLAASRRAIQANDGNAEAVHHFHRARRLALAAEEARGKGDEAAARRLAHASHVSTLSGIVAALGPGVAGEVASAAAAGLERLQGRLSGRDVPEAMGKRLAHVTALLERARHALEAGETVTALHHGLAAADALRHLAPHWLARHTLTEATRLLRAALGAVGDAPSEEEAAALRLARRLLAASHEALAAGHVERALESARRSARLSAGVLQGRSSTG